MSNRIDRRDLLRWSAVAAGSFLLAPLVGCVRPKPPRPQPRAVQGSLIGPGVYTHQGERVCVLSVINLDRPAGAPRLTRLSFFAHGVSPNPVEPRQAVLFEKQGGGCCAVDLSAGTVTRTITTRPERKFYGHGAWLADGSLLFATETDMTTLQGVIAVRDGKTFELQGDFPTYGAAPHDCKLVDGGKTLVITNGGGPIDGAERPCVTYVDVGSRKLLERIDIPNPKFNTGHLALTAAGDLAVVSAPRDGLPDQNQQLGGVSLRSAGAVIRSMNLPEDIVSRLKGETLSVCIHEPTGVVAATTPLGDVVTFWDIKKGTLVKSLDLPRPRGVSLTLDQKFFVVSHGEKVHDVVLIDAGTLEPIPGSKISESFITGSHLITYDLPA